MSNSNLYFEAQSLSVKNGGIGLIAKNGGSGIKIEEWRVWFKYCGNIVEAFKEISEPNTPAKPKKRNWGVAVWKEGGRQVYH